MDRKKFKHHFQVRVRNYEVDWQGIVHNANYLLYFEVARMEYLKHLGLKVDIDSIQNDSRVVLARNEIDYISPARFNDLLNIYTRISSIRNTSFVFEGLMEHATSNDPVSENIAVHVWLNARTREPMTVSDEFRSLIQKFEGDSVAITGPTLFT